MKKILILIGLLGLMTGCGGSDSKNVSKEFIDNVNASKSYSLSGSLEIINDELGNIDELLKEGRVKEITKYLIDNIYVNGGAYTSFEIFDKIWGKEITAQPLIKYFNKKHKK